jgi:hypothetical protein
MTTQRARSVLPFTELPYLDGTTERHSWGTWGSEDELGTINFIGPEQVRRAAALVRDGDVISLSLPLDQPGPGLFAIRTVYKHTLTKGSHGRDDRLDGFYPQFSSQWDGLRHVRYRQFGFYGGRQDEDVDIHGKLGIEHWAEHGLISRGVLIDAKRYFEGRGEPFSANECHPVTPSDLDAILTAQGARVLPGDVVLLRTGWLEWYTSLPEQEREALTGTVGQQPRPLACPGLDASQATAEWLWDHQVAAAAADNAALEALPVDRQVGFLHYRLLPMLGMPIGEFWKLDALSRKAAATSRYEFMLTSGVLNLPGGVGSPTNAYAIF